MVLLDYGAKANIARELNKRGCNVAVMPYDTKAEDILALHPDGIMLSNGPGDPAENTAAIAQLKKLIGKAPIFGICLGHQLLALAMGCKTEKLKYGHRGVNQPVKDLQTGRTYISSQNHGYAVVNDTIEASGGTLFLDELNSMSLVMQSKLLRVLQEKSVTPLGASKPIPLDVRIIASTNRPISEVVASGQMREDILYRINTISIQIPPLRRRLDDIPLLAAAFVEKYSAEMGKQVAGVAPEVTAFLMNRSWRGNVRELEHVIESAMNVVEDGQTVELEHLPIYLSEVDELEEDTPEHSPREAVSLNEALAAYEKKLILAAMKASNWKIVDAAARLRIPRTSLQYKLEKYDIKRR